KNEYVDWNNWKIGINSVNSDPQSTFYTKKGGDVALEVDLQVLNQANELVGLPNPAFFIRGAQALHNREMSGQTNIPAKSVNIDTKNNKFQLLIGERPTDDGAYTLDVAANFDRSDYVVLEAIVFPWISLVWIGCTLMTIGLSLAMFVRIRQLNQVRTNS